MAFWLSEYDSLLQSLIAKGYSLVPVMDYFRDAPESAVFLRHDVDRLVSRAVAMARCEHTLGARGTYYFRCTDGGVFPEPQIREIAALGHEVGYHYETFARASGDNERAHDAFKAELAALREIADVYTVAAHGSPLSKNSNMKFSQQVALSDLDILGEPSVDFDFDRVLYITDTGGSYGSQSNVRDRVEGQQLQEPLSPAEVGTMLTPDTHPQVLLNSHPERWASTAIGYVQAQTQDVLVNLVKRVLSARTG